MSEYRQWFNEWIKRNARGEVLEIGKSDHWDYGFTCLDKYKDVDIKVDILNNDLPDGQYDTILCNGMFEHVANPQKMVDEVWRLLKYGGQAIFGFVGEDYPLYLADWHYYDNNINFNAFNIKAAKIFNKEYYFIICEKNKPKD